MSNRAELKKAILLDILKRSGLGVIKLKDIASSLRTPLSLVEEGVEELKDRGLLKQAGLEGCFEVRSRVELALEAMKLGASSETVGRWLRWRDFEKLCREAFELNNFKVLPTFRFKAEDRWYEVDLLALKPPLMMAIDCKSWDLGRGGSSTLRKAVDRQVERVEALAKNFLKFKERFEAGGCDEILLVPSIVTLFEKTLRMHRGVSIVPIFKLNNFIQEIYQHLDLGYISLWKVKL